MTDKAQFEAMLEALINEDQEAAKEIFHNIVVGKSREIYEELLEADFGVPEEEEEEEGEEEAPMDNPFGDDSEEEEGDEEGEEEGEEEEEDGDLEDRVLDLEDALEELKQEFEELMAGEENEPEHADMFGGEEEDEFGGEEDEFGGELGDEDEEVKEIHHFHHDGDAMDEVAMFKEYVNKVALPKHGDNGVQTRSSVAGKNDMGGTAANIAKSFSTQSGGTQGGLLNPSSQPQTGGNVNVPGAKSATKLSNVKQQPMKKAGADAAQNKKSIIGGK